MPLVDIQWFPGRTLDQKREVIEVLTRELSRIGDCPAEAITVTFREVSREDWGRGGKLFFDHYEHDSQEHST